MMIGESLNRSVLFRRFMLTHGCLWIDEGGGRAWALAEEMVDSAVQISVASVRQQNFLAEKLYARIFPWSKALNFG